MKKVLFSILGIFSVMLVSAQGISPYSVRNFRFGMETTADIWLNKPDDLKLRNINRGINFSLMYHHRLGKSNFGIAGGLGIGSKNMYMKNAVLQTNSDGISEFKVLASGVSLKKSKLNMTFLEVPVEFNYKTKGHMTFAIGAKAGYLLADKTKYTGPENITVSNSTEVKKKFHNNPNLLQYNLGAFALIGYKWFNLTANYGFTNLFEDNKGPEMSPLSVGVLVRPY